MGVVSLQRHDNRLASRTLTTTSPNPKPNNSRPRRGRRSPKGTDQRPSSTSPQRLVMGEVRILKRGEALPKDNSRAEKRKPVTSSPVGRKTTGENRDLVLCSTDRLGPEPETVCKQVKILDLYAGAVTAVPSPAPSALPFPARLIKSSGGCGVGEGFAAAVGLRRLLRI